ncbi:substrate-binding domain-containing protein [Ruminococcus gauvreauii]|uniref:Substrate-binding domain-containing protein n=1 Tax=Ruminococcus gauvreauii TaxID=438033 RepID=A0ABY5VKJ1_9FIRM|nr:substrate-binding domain-containing protein [Ruminococcus gauvreauii]UWP61089.1 substrate-binding domain-containing protein [Ruminococcus gauvreauii]
MKKRVLGIMLTLAMAVGLLGGCGNASDIESADEKTEAKTEEGSTETAEKKSAEDLHIVYITPLLASDVWLVSKEGFDAAADEFGFTGDWVGPANIDVDSMIKQMEIAIAEGVDGIITCGLNPEAMVNVMSQADEAGIPVVLVNAGSEIEAPYFAYIGTNGETLGAMAAEEVAKKLGDEAPQVIYVGSTITNSSVIDTTNGYKSVFEGVSGYQELSLEENNDDLATSVDLWQNLFTTYPDVNVCANVSPAGAVGAAQVATEMGLLDKLTIMSIDDTQEVLDLIREGKIYGTMSQNYYRMGYQAAQWIVEYQTEGKEPAEKINDSGTVFVNKDNVDTFGESLRDMSSWK